MSIQFKKSVLLLAAAGVFSLGLTGCGDKAKSDVKVIKVGVVGEYNVQWDTVNENLAADKLRVELVKYSDYATPNRALADKEIDLNAFQHKAYLANDVKRNGYKVTAIGDTVVTPLRIFNNKAKISKLEDIKDGDKIAIPADLTNGGRALKLLEAESGMLANLLPDVAAAVINGGNAFTAKLDPYKDSICSENVDPKTNPYYSRLVNVIVARDADVKNPDYLKVVKAYHAQNVAQTLKDYYKGAYIPAWAGAADYKLK